MNLIIISCVIFTIVTILAFFPLYAKYKDKDIEEIDVLAVNSCLLIMGCIGMHVTNILQYYGVFGIIAIVWFICTLVQIAGSFALYNCESMYGKLYPRTRDKKVEKEN
jgi:O-antigen/teichoic acid export membrane protein